MRAQLFAALRVLLVLTVLTGVVYPLAVTGIAQVAFGDQADGSLVTRDGVVVGSALLGQALVGPEWFHSRPSAAGDGVSSGSNLGPTNEDFLATVDERVASYRSENGLADDTPVPVDAVTASGSGFDPHISVANARLQAPRVAEARGMSVDDVLALVAQHTDGRSLGFLGESGVDVLALNLAVADAAPEA